MSNEGSGDLKPKDTLVDRDARDTIKIPLADLASAAAPDAPASEERSPALTGAIDVDLGSKIVMILTIMEGKADYLVINRISEVLLEGSETCPGFKDRLFRERVAKLIVEEKLDVSVAVERAQKGDENVVDTHDTIAQVITPFQLEVRKTIAAEGLDPKAAAAVVKQRIADEVLDIEEE